MTIFKKSVKLLTIQRGGCMSSSEIKDIKKAIIIEKSNFILNI